MTRETDKARSKTAIPGKEKADRTPFLCWDTPCLIRALPEHYQDTVAAIKMKLDLKLFIWTRFWVHLTDVEDCIIISLKVFSIGENEAQLSVSQWTAKRKCPTSYLSTNSSTLRKSLAFPP